jgi:hypothetical protein
MKFKRRYVLGVLCFIIFKNVVEINYHGPEGASLLSQLRTELSNDVGAVVLGTDSANGVGGFTKSLALPYSNGTAYNYNPIGMDAAGGFSTEGQLPNGIIAIAPNTVFNPAPLMGNESTVAAVTPSTGSWNETAIASNDGTGQAIAYANSTGINNNGFASEAIPMTGRGPMEGEASPSIFDNVGNSLFGAAPGMPGAAGLGGPGGPGSGGPDDPFGGGTPSDTPLDGGLSLLMAAAIGKGAKSLRKYKKTKELSLA